MITGERVPPERVYKNDWIRVEDDGDKKLNIINNDDNILHVSDK